MMNDWRGATRRASILLLAVSLLCASFESAADLAHGHAVPAESAALAHSAAHDMGGEGAMDSHHCPHCLHSGGQGEASDILLFEGAPLIDLSPSYLSRPGSTWSRQPPIPPPIRRVTS
jgi:hypothetical protein